MEPGRPEPEETLTAHARDRFDAYRRTIEDLPESAWQADTPRYVRVLQWLLLAGVGLGVTVTWPTPGRWWWFGGIIAGAAVLAVLIQLLVPPSEGEKQMLAELDAAIDELTELAKAANEEDVDPDAVARDQFRR